LRQINNTGIRSLVSVAFTCLRSLISFITGIFVARTLGVEEYGTMCFLLGTFIAIRQVMDLGSSSAFFTFLSRRKRSQRFVRYFAAWLAIQFSLPLLALLIIFPDWLILLVWRGEERHIVMLAFLAAFMQGSLWQVVSQIAESQRLTVFAQGFGLGLVTLHLLVICGLSVYEIIAIPWVLLAITAEWLIGSYFVFKLTKFDAESSKNDDIRTVFKEYSDYCAPLVPYAILSFLYEFIDRWLLQFYQGSIQQSYYSIGLQYVGLSLVITSSILNVLWKEIAEAHQLNDDDRVCRIYTYYSRLLFALSAAIAGLLIPWSEDILRETVGNQFVGGATTLTIILFSPVFQSVGQIAGVLFYAMGKTYIQMMIGMGLMVISILATCLVLIPEVDFFPGFGLASERLAAKTVFVNFVGFLTVTLILKKLLKIPLAWHYSVGILTLCILSGWICRKLMLVSLPFDSSWGITFVLSTLLHVVLTTLLILAISKNLVLRKASG
jgi:O-antigen/teichoic acid export membrane protein